MPRPATNAHRATVSLRETDLAKLDEVTEATKLNRNDAIRKALATEAFVQKVLAKGGKIVVEDASGNIREVAWVT